MITGKPPLNVYKACQDKAPVIISTVDTSARIWQSHSNYFSILWVQEGAGMIETDFSVTAYTGGTIYCFNNYQAFALQPESRTKALLLLFHPNFFCIETYQHEVGCNGVLFNQVFDIFPIVIAAGEDQELLQLLSHIEAETAVDEIAKGELVFSYLKIFLVKLTRLKTAQSPVMGPVKTIPPQLEKLITLINEHFSAQHKPSFYADSLHISLKALSNSSRQYFRKSISTLIHEKLLLRAKWELLHTSNQVKQIAAVLGFKDEYYFSRFFKKHIGLSPKLFRESEWDIRRGYLSIP
ncbi:AraC family transcriptional regulator [Chitinophaga sp. MM2321]|uniref:AraC family transcriptional regulator n=1 Tax=Chitinophaga sp. MM2321 TaxID=3137178 RepID=UPI0032D59B6E